MRILLAALALTSLTPAALAQQAAGVPMPQSYRDTQLRMLELQRSMLLAMADSMPESLYRARVTPPQRDFAQQIHHAAAAMTMLTTRFMGAPAPPLPDTAVALNSRVLQRALRERLLAAQLTQHYGREKVLEWYLNSANYARLAYGADAAARLYFAKPATDLNLAEAAMLAGVADDPGLNPFDAPHSAMERQKRVLHDMLRFRLAGPQAAASAAGQSLDFRPIERPGQALQISDLEPQIAPAFTQMVLEQLEKYIPRSRLDRGGLNIFTTLDYDLQQQVQCAAAEQLSRLGSTPVTNTTEGVVNCDAALRLPKLQLTQPISNLQADILILEPQTGQILAMVNQAPDGAQDSTMQPHKTGSLGIPFIFPVQTIWLFHITIPFR